jgi:hypothetical protein
MMLGSKSSGSRFRSAQRLCGSLALVIACAIALLSLTNGANAQPGERASATRQAAFSSHRIAPVLRKRYSILVSRRHARERAHATAEVLSTSVTDDPDYQRLASEFGIDTNAATAVEPAPGVTLWLVPGASGTCVVAYTAAKAAGVLATWSCGAIDVSQLGSETLAMSGTSGQLVTGFVPNGISSLTGSCR